MRNLNFTIYFYIRHFFTSFIHYYNKQYNIYMLDAYTIYNKHISQSVSSFGYVFKFFLFSAMLFCGLQANSYHKIDNLYKKKCLIFIFKRQKLAYYLRYFVRENNNKIKIDFLSFIIFDGPTI